MSAETDKSLVANESPLTTQTRTIVSAPVAKSRIGMFNFDIEGEGQIIRQGAADAYQKASEFLTQDLQDKGLLGEHDLLSPAVVKRGLWGNMKGQAEIRGFLFFIKGEAKIEGEEHTVSSVQFAWKPNEKDILVTEIPVDKLVVHEDPSAKTPHVSFTFNPMEFMDNIGVSYADKKQRVYEVGVKQFPHALDYLRKERLSKVTLTIASGEDLGGLPINSQSKAA